MVPKIDPGSYVMMFMVREPQHQENLHANNVSI